MLGAGLAVEPPVEAFLECLRPALTHLRLTENHE